MENKTLVSVIVPVYNRENTIIPCVESILKSEFLDFEILLIDDGSTDSTRVKCEQMTVRDKRIKFVHKRNEGVSVARNTGLAMARGEWITFVDSDDAILPCHLNVLRHKHSDSIDLIMTGHSSGKIVNGEVKTTTVGVGISQDVVTVSNAAAYLFNDFEPFKNPVYPIWNKFFKRQILDEHRIRFDSTMSLGEDQVFLCDYLQNARGLVYYKMKSYVNLSWPNLMHLGLKLRTPSDYLYNQKKNYQALCHIIRNGGGKTEQYAVNYGIDRPITRILYNYTKVENRNLLSLKELEAFTKSEIIPYLKTINTERYKPVDLNVRWISYLLLHVSANIAIQYCRIYNLFHPLYSFAYRVVRKFKRILK